MIVEAPDNLRPVAVAKEPVVGLAVPYESVAVDGNLVLVAPIHQSIRPLEAPPILAGMHGSWLQAILRRHNVEVLGDEISFRVGVVAGQIARRADQKVILVNVLDCRPVLIHGRRRNCRSCGTGRGSATAATATAN